MPILIPFINKPLEELAPGFFERIQDRATQRRLVLVIVCIALLLDNMLYMVIVPIIPVYLRSINAWTPADQARALQTAEQVFKAQAKAANLTVANWTEFKEKHFDLLHPLITYKGDRNEDASIGILFASKAIVQLVINPMSGSLIDRMGYDRPMLLGLCVLFFSTAVFAFGQSYATLFIARSLQGVGSAFADTSGLAMIADRYTEERERNKAMGIALAFISFGSLFAPPFGGVMYEFAGKAVPFLILALVALLDGGMLVLVMGPERIAHPQFKARTEYAESTPIWRLILDPYIAVCAGCLVMANVSLSFIEPTIAIWMKDTMAATEWEIGMVWLPAFPPHVFGVYLTVKLMQKYPQRQWLLSMTGLIIQGFSCLILPFCKTYGAVIFPLMVDCFGIAMVDTAILPTLGYLVDIRHTSVYGSVYAIADISYSLAYALGPVIAGGIVASVGFTWLNVGIFISNIAYAPLLFTLKSVYQYRPFEGEGSMLTTDGQDGQGQYKTYMVNGETGTTLKQAGQLQQGHIELQQRTDLSNGDPPNYDLLTSSEGQLGQLGQQTEPSLHPAYNDQPPARPPEPHYTPAAGVSRQPAQPPRPAPPAQPTNVGRAYQTRQPGNEYHDAY